MSERTEQRRQLDREEQIVEDALEHLERLRQIATEVDAFEEKPELLTEKLPPRQALEGAGS